MAKILLVEDDNNLREIYEARLAAEGFEIVSARDGEEALVVAKAAMPDLVISDVMMPKISGFEMLDILRNTDGLKHVKVIMLTALGQAEDQTRADQLGADRYLVKSQVTLEDIVNVATQLLNPSDDSAATAAPADEPADQPAADDTAAPAAAAPAAEVAPAPAPAPEPEQEPEPVEPAAAPNPAPEPEPEAAPEPAPIAEPASEPGQPGDQLAISADGEVTQTSAQEEAVVEEQIGQFVDNQSGDAPASVEPTEEPSGEAQTAVPETTTPETAPDSAPETVPEASPVVSVAPTETAPTTTPDQEKALADALDSLGGAKAEEADAPKKADADLPEINTGHKRIIEPSDDKSKKSIQELLVEEEAKESGKTALSPAASDKPKPAGPAVDDPSSISL